MADDLADDLFAGGRAAEFCDFATDETVGVGLGVGVRAGRAIYGELLFFGFRAAAEELHNRQRDNLFAG